MAVWPLNKMEKYKEISEDEIRQREATSAMVAKEKICPPMKIQKVAAEDRKRRAPNSKSAYNKNTVGSQADISNFSKFFNLLWNLEK